MPHVPDFWVSLVAFAVVLGVEVFIHELGHYLAARWRGVHVEAFSIGFGPALLGWTDRRGTRWRLSLLPLGGYVKLHGQERPQDVPEEVRASWIPGRTYHEKSVLSRAIVIVAGPVANFVLAIAVFSLVYGLAGEPLASPAVGAVVKDSPAVAAGLMADDRIVSIDGQPSPTADDVVRQISSAPGRQITIVVRRGDTEKTLTATPEAAGPAGAQRGKLGIQVANTEMVRVNPIRALSDGVRQTGGLIWQTLAGIGSMITGHTSTDDLGGPLRIAALSGQVARLGIVSFVSFIAILSVNLGLLNLFPIPILDGGHLLFLAAEAVRGRPIPPRAQEFGFRAGLAVLATLMLFVTWHDLKLQGFMHWVASLLG